MSIKIPDLKENYEKVLSQDCINFIEELNLRFNDKRNEILNLRLKIQEKINKGWTPSFLEETQEIRNGNWEISSIPKDLLDRRVEITGPPTKKMVINALNSGSNTFMADFEDSLSPTWSNLIEGQINLKNANNRTIDFKDTKKNKDYKLNENTAVLIVRPRGWHLEEKNFLQYNKRTSASLFDFGVYFFNNYETLLKNNTAPYYYLPKLENHLEARLWEDVINFTEEKFNLKKGTIKVTVLIETILAAFEMDEILYELKDHIVGLNCGRWDYIFSFIKKFKKRNDFILPDRSLVSMKVHFMKSYSTLLIKTCHKRRALAIGGMAAQIPIKGDEAANKIAIQKVYDDKLIEAYNGHDGTWVAHPALVSVAKSIFDNHLYFANQIGNLREDINVKASDLLKLPVKTSGGRVGVITENGIRTNINIGILYIESWLKGNGCVPLYNLMEDAATAEISRAQIWQWLHHRSKTNNGILIDKKYIENILNQELQKIKEKIGKELFEKGYYDKASNIFINLCVSEKFEDFLTIPSYEYL
ncbi:MAG: malate synthase A [Pelagibacteraceae bacterium]|nr:malate synthase A [Pelagibacteraceae bacterium]